MHMKCMLWFESWLLSHAFRRCGDFILFSWKGRKVNDLRRLKESLGPSGSALTRFRGRFWRPVSDRRFQISGIFGAPTPETGSSGRRLWFAVGLRLTKVNSTGRRARSKARRGDLRPRVRDRSESWRVAKFSAARSAAPAPVSYTHLTLPTILRV